MKNIILISSILLCMTKFFAQESQFTDSRDGKTYRTVAIGNQIWMAENLAYKPDGGYFWIYNNNENFGERYGYLYSWKTACKVCPSGWRLPGKGDFNRLKDYVGNSQNKLKSLGFKVLYSGYRSRTRGVYDAIGGSSKWWTKTKTVVRRGDPYNDETAWGFGFYKSRDEFSIIDYDINNYGYSVRCIKSK